MNLFEAAMRLKEYNYVHPSEEPGEIFAKLFSDIIQMPDIITIIKDAGGHIEKARYVK